MDAVSALDAAFVEQVAAALQVGGGVKGLDANRLLPGLVPPGDPNAALKLVALAGQARRFLRPPTPARFDEYEPDASPRAILPPAARPLLRRLALQPGGVVSQAVADAMERRALRLHPFDLQRLAPFVKAFREELGVRAPVDGEGATGEAGAGYFAIDVVDENNWPNATPSRQAVFIRALRAKDPAHGREVLAAGFAALPAPARHRALETMETGLGPDDTAFLAGLSADRAPKVRALAEALQSRIPGGESFEKRLAAAKAGLKLTTSGVFRRKQSLSLNTAFAAGSVEERVWVNATFGGLTLDALAQSQGLGIEAFCDALDGKSPLWPHVWRQALVERRFALLNTLGGAQTPDLWSRILIRIDPEQTPTLAQGDEAAFLDALWRPQSWSAMPNAYDFVRLYDFLRAPLPQRHAEALLDCKPLAAALSDEALLSISVELLPAIAALTPAALRARLRPALASLSLATATPTLNLIDAFDLIDPA